MAPLNLQRRAFLQTLGGVACAALIPFKAKPKHGLSPDLKHRALRILSRYEASDAGILSAVCSADWRNDRELAAASYVGDGVIMFHGDICVDLVRG